MYQVEYWEDAILQVSKHVTEEWTKITTITNWQTVKIQVRQHNQHTGVGQDWSEPLLLTRMLLQLCKNCFEINICYEQYIIMYYA